MIIPLQRKISKSHDTGFHQYMMAQQQSINNNNDQQQRLLLSGCKKMENGVDMFGIGGSGLIYV